MTYLGTGLGHTWPQLRCPRTPAVNYRPWGDLLERQHSLVLGGPHAHRGGEPPRGSCLRLPYKDGAEGAQGRDGAFCVPSVWEGREVS